MAPKVQQNSSPSDEYAQVVWASHILSYLNPFTCSKANGRSRPVEPGSIPGVLAEDDAEFESSDDDDDPETDAIITSDAPHLRATRGEQIRQKYLNCIAELLAHKKGGKHVAATALRENEDSVEVDIASNSPFNKNYDEYLVSLSRLLSKSDTWETTQMAVAEGCHTHSLLEVTVTRNANRLDGLIEAFAKLFPVAVSGSLNSSEKHQSSVSGETDELVRRVQTFSSSLAVTGEAKAPARLAVVRLAMAAVLKPETALVGLERLAPSADGSKAARFCRLIARPAVNLRTLACIACLLPNFRAVDFVKVQTPGPTRLREQQVLGIAQAWSRLGLPPIDEFSQSLIRRDGQFRRDCARPFPVHCDAQLLLRYETDPSLAPTLPFVGCSKKACFLCHALLSVLTRKLKVRGQHGVCHPRWGVGPLQSERTRYQLRQLCSIIREKIVMRLCPRKKRPLPLAIPQSSAASDLRPADIAFLRRQAARRAEMERRNQEYRERMQILLHPRSVRPPASTSQGSLMCIMCQSNTDGSGRCKGCRSALYCSKDCQSVDRPAHQLLCLSYRAFLHSRPSTPHKLGIWFPRNAKQPRLIWVPMAATGESKQDRVNWPELDCFLGSSAHKTHISITVRQNQRRGVDIGHDIKLYFRRQRTHDKSLTNVSLHHAVEACHGMTVFWEAYDHLVAMRGEVSTVPSNVEASDMTLGDFRHILDWFGTQGDTTVRDTPTGGSISALHISCQLERKLYGYDLFRQVYVQSGLPFPTEPSKLSIALGIPLLVGKPSPGAAEPSTPGILGMTQDGLHTHNAYATPLMIETDVSSQNWGKPLTIWERGGVITRQDRTDLDPSSAIRLCRYCFEVLQPMFRQALAGEITRDAVMKEICPEKLAAWIPSPLEPLEA